MNLLVVVLCIASASAFLHDGIDIRHLSRQHSSEVVQTRYACQFESTLTLSETPCPTKYGTVATAKYKNAINSTGWAYLEVETNPHFQDSTQAYAAGLVEASVTQPLIKAHLTNTLYDDCQKPKGAKMTAFCKKLMTYLRTNIDYMRRNAIAKSATDPYWHQVKLILYQLAGLADTYNAIGKEQNLDDVLFEESLSYVSKMLFVQLAGDLMDLEQALGKPKHLWRKKLGFGSCSALIKPTDGNRDLLVSHDTWSTYQSMLRILKAYKLPYRMTGKDNADSVPSPTITFSSYPATLFSIDDFYTTSNGLVVQETTIECANPELYKHVRAEGTVLTWMRAMVATRLATGAKHWTEVFKQYNNQWMVVDYNKFTPGHPLPEKDLFVVLEQMPGYIAVADMTAHLDQHRYWPSYNSPYFKEIQNVSGAAAAAKKHGDWFSYDKTPRALIFKERHASVQNMTSLRALMRYNNYRHDPLSRCNCTPPYSAENAIAARCDLNPKNGTYPFAALGHRSHGAIDMKAISFADIKRQSFVAESGPTHDQLEVFSWSTADFASTTPHVGHPNRWAFPPVHVKWSITK